MFLSYKDCIEKYQNDYFLEQAISTGKLFKVEKGIYSDGGADNIVREVSETFKDKKIKAVLGGFHLFCLPDSVVKAFAERLNSLGVEKIVTGHCTGDHAYEILKSVLGDKVCQMYTGMEMEI